MSSIPTSSSWARQRYELSRRVEAWTGNPAQIVELSASELAEAVELDPAPRRVTTGRGRIVVGDIAAAPTSRKGEPR